MTSTDARVHMQCFWYTHPAEFLLVLWNLTDVPPKVLDRELVCEGGRREGGGGSRGGYNRSVTSISATIETNKQGRFLQPTSGSSACFSFFFLANSCHWS